MKLTIDGKDYEFSVEAAKSAGILKEILPRRTISVGQKYKNRFSGNIYVIAIAGHNLVQLINIVSGKKLTELATSVSDVNDISDEMFNVITDYSPNLFDFVEVEISVK